MRSNPNLIALLTHTVDFDHRTNEQNRDTVERDRYWPVDQRNKADSYYAHMNAWRLIQGQNLLRVQNSVDNGMPHNKERRTVWVIGDNMIHFGMHRNEVVSPEKELTELLRPIDWNVGSFQPMWGATLKDITTNLMSEILQCPRHYRPNSCFNSPHV